MNYRLTLRIFLVLLLLVSGSSAFGQWISLGPDSVPALMRPFDGSLKFASGIGRVSCLRFFKDGDGKEIMYLGTPYGGLWKKTVNGPKWEYAGAAQLPNQGVSDFLISRRKTDKLFILSGDPDCILNKNAPALGSTDCQSRGIFISKDGGQSWSDNAAGLWMDENGVELIDFWKFPTRKVARKLLVDPRCSRRMLTVIHTYTNDSKTFDGMIFNSNDGGQKWIRSFYGKDAYLRDMEWKPRSKKTVYASGRSVLRSNDRGKSWFSLQLNGLPADSSVIRCEITLSNAAPDNIYALVIYSHSPGGEIFLSENSGESFRSIARTQASPHWRTAIAVSHKDPGLIFFSGGNKVYKLKKENGQWKQSFSGGSIHDDVHDLTFDPKGNRIYASTDGGIYSSEDEGRTWLDESTGLNIAECWSVGVSQSGPLIVASGLQDCGTIIRFPEDDSLRGWWITRGGDGMAVEFDPYDNRLIYANDGNNNIVSRSEDRAQTWSRNLAPTREQKAMYRRPFVRHEKYSGLIFTAYHDVFKSSDKGDSWKKISDFSFISKDHSIVAMAVSASDTNVIYAAYSSPAWSDKPEKKLWKTRNGGETWTDISHGLTGVHWNEITDILVDQINPEIVYVSFQGGWKYKIMKSVSGGEGKEPWKDYSNGLPDDGDVLCLAKSVGAQSLFAGTINGIYKRSHTDGSWRSINYNMPRQMISDIAVRESPLMLFAGTHGMGIWMLHLSLER
ncbi:MAG: hypothetical protein DWQ39_08920 [Bacteroidetes bacterium]|nr:MAG: hypothetical protein DWQ33_10755 [Bacteroidota bacterium]REK05303.1 MAG: hypothetical protein DWQ39_08920 [Bacteroidota bacterium]REK48845.1 MAG: hypothetical protein DWQ48_08170 [Bacteroidota bacterium]